MIKLNSMTDIRPTIKAQMNTSSPSYRPPQRGKPPLLSLFALWLLTLLINLWTPLLGQAQDKSATITTANSSNVVIADDPSVVTIPDANLKQRLASAVGKNSADDLYNTDLLGITRLYTWHDNIQDLTGIEHCLNLTDLELHGNPITNFSGLSQLSKLETLKLDHLGHSSESPLDIQNLVDQLDELENLTRLELDSNYNSLTDISPMAALTNLTFLNLSSNYSLTKVSSMLPALT
ncbi:MAG: hypothetical protein QF569_23765, partial [Candidatus Poribacteria bacterium]|nr:hypothetical protein [Candidatus Poribacteria bacterium]